MEFKKSMEEPATEAKRKRLRALDYPSFWDSIEVHAELHAAATRSTEAAVRPDVADSEANRPSVLEYFASEFSKSMQISLGSLQHNLENQNARLMKTVIYWRNPLPETAVRKMKVRVMHEPMPLMSA